MAWFLLARALFTGAVAYTAFLLRPIGPDALVNVLFGLSLAGVAVLFEWLLRDLALANVLGALLGRAIGLAIAKGIGAALFWADASISASRSCTASSCCCCRISASSSAAGKVNGSSLRGCSACFAPRVRSGGLQDFRYERDYRRTGGGHL